MITMGYLGCNSDNEPMQTMAGNGNPVDADNEPMAGNGNPVDGV